MHYDNLVFGATLESLFFSLHHGYPLIYCSPRHPPFYKSDEAEAWEGAYFTLSMSGLILFADHLRSFKFVSDNQFLALTDKKRYEVTVDNLFIFDEGVRSLPESKNSVLHIEVLDYMRVRGFLLNAPPVLTDVGYNIYIYKSPRGGRPEIKDLCLSRVLDPSQLPGDSELISRFFVEEKLKQYFKKDVMVESESRELIYSMQPSIFNSGNLSLLNCNLSTEWRSTSDYAKFLLKEFHD